jgi:hypothetical protein
VSWKQVIGAVIGAAAFFYFYYGFNVTPSSPSSRPSTAKVQPKAKAGSKPRPEVDVKVGEYATIKQCLAAIHAAVGPLDIARDRPNEIIGTTSDDQMFSCSEKVTGSRGMYYQGWYEVVRPGSTTRAGYAPQATPKVRGNCSAEEAWRAFKEKHPDMPEPPSMGMQLPCPNDP